MPLPRFAKLPEDRQRELLDAARAEFAAHGFAGASFNRIIATTGVSKGAMYYYFADKADLYEAVLEEVLDRMQRIGEELGPPSGKTPDEFWSELTSRAVTMHGHMVSDAELTALGHKLYASGVGLQHITARLNNWVQALIELGQRVGAVRKDVPLPLLSNAVTGLMMGLDRYFITMVESASPAEMVELPVKALKLVRDLAGAR